MRRMPMLARILPYAKERAQEVIVPGDTVIDATCGNGHDTRFLSELTGPGGHVLSLDIQPGAIENARELCSPARKIELILDSHANVDRYLGGRPVKTAMITLASLPKGNKTSTTEYKATILAIEKIIHQI